MMTKQEKERSQRFNEVIIEFKKKTRDLERKVYLYQYAMYLAIITGIVIGFTAHEIGVQLWSL
jgi:hypothetical protein